MAIVKALLTPADAEEMLDRGELPADGSWELADGEIIWLAPANGYHGEVCTTITGILYPFARDIGARLFDGQTGFMVGEHRQQLRSPDVSLVLKERGHIVPNEGFAREAPDFAVEVLSRDEFGEAYARTKVSEYCAAGATLVWIVDPYRQLIRAYQPGRVDYDVYAAEDEITLDVIAPGFKARVRDLFPRMG